MSSDQSVHQTSTIDTAPGRRIVVGVDGSPSSLSALEWAVHQAELTGASLVIVAAWDWPVTFGWSTIPEAYDPAAEMRQTIEPMVDALRSSHPRVAMETKVVEGHPAPVLIKESTGAALLVVGSRGHGEFVGMLIGSTSEHCVANAACPVVVIRGNA